MREPRVLIADIEMMYSEASVFGTGKQYISWDDILEDGFMICWAAQWLGSDEVEWDAVINYTPGKLSLDGIRSAGDYGILDTLRDRIESADMLVGHNFRNFDLKTIQARMMANEMPPIVRPPVFDTYKEMTRVAKFPSHKLAYLSNRLLEREKLRTDKDLWHACRRGDRSAWNQMIDYCVRDVEATTELYVLLRPWAVSHPNLVLLDPDGTPRCPRCRAAVTKNGERTLTTHKYQRYCCSGCGCPNLRGTNTILSADDRNGMVINAG